MAQNVNANWLWLLIPAFIFGMFLTAQSVELAEPEVVTEYITETVEVEVPGETIEVEVSATGLDALDDLVDNAMLYFEDHMYKVDEWNSTDYDLDEMDIEDYDDISLEIDDWDDNEYTVSFYVDIEYDDGDDNIEGTWLVEVAYDEDGDVDLDVTAQ